ncbi:MAG: CBS domain-containing protein [Deltaproteobacteria bacterium]|nr:CBS domain-containing protein [Deltaproteobacteria bacterium]
MGTVKELLHGKRDALWTIHPGATVYRALEVMAQHDIGALPVVEDERLVGIFSERDYARKVILAGRSSRDTPVSDLMVREVLCVTPRATIEECMGLMTQKRVRHLPVLDGDALVGIVTIGDVVKRLLGDQASEIDALHRYIHGSY